MGSPAHAAKTIEAGDVFGDKRDVCRSLPARTPFKFRVPLLMSTTFSKNAMAAGAFRVTAAAIFFSVRVSFWALTPATGNIRNGINNKVLISCGLIAFLPRIRLQKPLGPHPLVIVNLTDVTAAVVVEEDDDHIVPTEVFL